MEEGHQWEILFHLEFDQWFTKQPKGLQLEIWALLDALARRWGGRTLTRLQGRLFAT
jgi:hypothetical protein